MGDPVSLAVISLAGALGRSAIQANAQKSIANKQMEAQRSIPAPAPMQAPMPAANRMPNTPGGSLMGGQPSSGAEAPYSGGGNRYNSAQTLSTAPSLSGTGSGFNGAALLGQAQPGQQLGQTGVA